MTKTVITEEQRKEIGRFLDESRPAELINTYLYFIELKHNLHPVLFPKEKVIFQSAEEAIHHLESEGNLWHETEIKIGFGHASVNEETTKVYICPFTGKVFGDNTHPNPQDAIYDWVSKCPENTERVGGLRVKRFFVSEDAEVIKNYIDKTKVKKEAIKKVVYSSVLSGKLFNSKKAVVDDFKRNYLKEMSLVEVQNQNKFKLEDKFLELIQKQLVEEKITSFVEALAEYEEFLPYIERWVEAED